ncbi:MAG: type II toxin-antitoxin system VapC family toxin [Roseiarcus sp.]|jgi:ribonuclease VapC
MFVAASAVVAILARDPEAAELSAKIAAATHPISTGHVLLEASMRLASILRVRPDLAKDAVLEMFGEAGIDVVSIDRVVGERAVAAFARFGKGRGGPAQLNFGDCLSYACASVHGAAILFKGEDFAGTDARRA